MTSKFPFVFPGEAPQVSDQSMPTGEVGGLLPNVNEVRVCVELNLSFSEWIVMVCVLCMYVCWYVIYPPCNFCLFLKEFLIGTIF